MKSNASCIHSEADDHGTPPLAPFISAVRQAHGLDLSPFDETFLKKAFHRRLTATSVKTWEAYLGRLQCDRAEAEALLRSLRIGHSEFFRNPLTFAVLEQLVLPDLLAAKEMSGRSEIRVWSAGCAAGQEAYSVAILLDELSAAREHPIPFRIIATDISEVDLARGREGVYDRAAVQNVRAKHLRDYFCVRGEAHTVDPRLRQRVDFSTYDLLDERSVCPPASLYGGFDLILCCNVIFYYQSDMRKRILDKVCRALAPRGYFVTGEAERDIVQRTGGCRAVASPAAVFQKKKINHG